MEEIVMYIEKLANVFGQFGWDESDLSIQLDVSSSFIEVINFYFHKNIE